MLQLSLAKLLFTPQMFHTYILFLRLVHALSCGQNIVCPIFTPFKLQVKLSKISVDNTFSSKPLVVSGFEILPVYTLVSFSVESTCLLAIVSH